MNLDEITFEFATQDDCLDKMVPSDLRQLVSQRDSLLESKERLKKDIQLALDELIPQTEENEDLRAHLFMALDDTEISLKATFPTYD